MGSSPGKSIKVHDVKSGYGYYRETDMPGVYHYGIGYRAKGTSICIIDWSDGRDEDGTERPVRIIKFSQFKDGKDVYEVKINGTKVGKHPRSVKDVVATAKSFVNKPGSYDVIDRNCAQFAFFCLYKDWDRMENVPLDVGQSSDVKTRTGRERRRP